MYAEVKGRQCGGQAQGGCEAEQGPGCPPAELGRGSSSPPLMAPGVWVTGRG